MDNAPWETAEGSQGAGEPSAYLDLLKKVLTRYLFQDSLSAAGPRKGTPRYRLFRLAQRFLARYRCQLVHQVPFDARSRAEGRDWPLEAETMVGLKRLDNIEFCVGDVLRRGVPGDLMETGVWRGGAVIFMRAVLKEHGDTSRTVWGADSFQGLPKVADQRHTDDIEDALWTAGELAISLDQVKDNFRRYGFLDEQVRFLPGWFQDTLPKAPVERLAVLRLDGDMYESTMVALEALYPKLSVGGYLIVDDYHAVRGCRRAVDDFRARHGITDEMQRVDWSCVYWRRSD